MSDDGRGMERLYERFAHIFAARKGQNDGPFAGSDDGPNERGIGQLAQSVVDHAARERIRTSQYDGPRKTHTLKAWLAHDFTAAFCWEDLQTGLRARGYMLAESGCEIELCTIDGERLCSVAELGYPRGALIRRFGAFLPTDLSISRRRHSPTALTN